MPESLLNAVWKVTLAGTVLLDFSDYTEAEPELIPAVTIQPAPLLRAPALKRFLRGNGSLTLSYTRVVVCADPTAAQNRRLSEIATLPRVIGDCAVQVLGAGGVVGILRNAMIDANGFKPTVEAHLFKCAYQIVGETFEMNPANVLETEHGEALTDENGNPITL